MDIDIDPDFEWEEDENQAFMDDSREFMDMEVGMRKEDVWIMIQELNKKDFAWIKEKINSK